MLAYRTSLGITHLVTWINFIINNLNRYRGMPHLQHGSKHVELRDSHLSGNGWVDTTFTSQTKSYACTWTICRVRRHFRKTSTSKSTSDCTETNVWSLDRSSIRYTQTGNQKEIGVGSGFNQTQFCWKFAKHIFAMGAATRRRPAEIVSALWGVRRLWTHITDTDIIIETRLKAPHYQKLLRSLMYHWTW